MEKRVRSAVCLVIVGLVTSVSAGCMSPPAIWRPPADGARFKPSGNALVVMPVEDRRNPINEDPSWLAIVPLVPWTTETDEMFEWVLPHPGSREGRMLSAEMLFDAEMNLRHAIRRRLSRGKLFEPVLLSDDGGRTAPGGKRAFWTLRTTLDRLTLKRVRLRYGLGPLAFVAYAFGAPEKKLWIEMKMRLTLSDPNGEVKYKGRIDKAKAIYDGWYWSPPGEQRALDAVAAWLGEAIDAMQRDVSAHNAASSISAH